MSSEQFPLCKALGLQLVRAIGMEREFTYVRAADLERLLESAPVVYMQKREGCLIEADSQPRHDDTHTARLVCIQPIVRDSAESLLREAIDNSPSWLNHAAFMCWLERAVRLLEGE